MKYALLLCIFSVLIVILINFVSSYFKILIYRPNLSHKEKFENTIFNTGGLIFFLYLIILYIFNSNFYDLNIFLSTPFIVLGCGKFVGPYLHL